MTNLTRAITRRTIKPYGGNNRRLIIRLEPNDILSMRQERARRWCRAPLISLFRLLAVRDIEDQMARFDDKVKDLMKGGMSRCEAEKKAKGIINK